MLDIRALDYRNVFKKIIAVVLSLIIIYSVFSIAQTKTIAQTAGGKWDYKAYGIDKDAIYPQQSTWNWPINIGESDGNVFLKYNNASCNYAYTSAITKVSPHKAHISLEVTEASKFFVMFGLKQHHYQLNSVSFRINKANRTIEVYVGTTSNAQKITTLTNVNAFDNTNSVEVRLTKVSTGYSFKFNDYEYILQSNDFNQYNSYLKGCFDRNDTNIWFNVAPDTSTPKFCFSAIHSGEQVCYDELAENHSSDEMNSLFDTIYAIENIDSQITLESKFSIETARSIYDSTPESLKGYIHNYNDLVFAEDAYKAILKESVNIDSFLYPITLRNIGPSIFGGWENKVSFKEANEGVSIEFSETTVHNAGLNVNNPLSLNGMHIRFKNNEFMSNGENFAIMFYPVAQIGVNDTRNMLWLTFSVKNTGVIVKVYSKNNKSGTEIISTNQLKKADLEKKLDLLFTPETDGGYKIVLNGSVNGKIPESYITDAKNEGLNLDSLYVTLGSNCLGTPANGSKIKVDCVSIHDCFGICSDELYDEFGEDGVVSLKEAIKAINAIELPITEESNLAILTAETTYNSLEDELKQYVTNYDELVTKKNMFNRIEKEKSNIDSFLYPVTLRNIGPSIFSGWEDKVSFTETEEGVTVEFTETTVHNAGLNVNNPLSMDGLHLRFANCEYKHNGESFALMFYKNAQIDIINQSNVLWLTFLVKDNGVTIKAYSKNNKSGITVINTSQITKSDLKDWDILLTKEKNGDYKVTINGAVSGIIPEAYIKDAKSEGLDVKSMYVTLGSNCLGTPAKGSKLKVDCISAHDKNGICSNELYEKFGKDGVLSLKTVIAAIDAIKLPVTSDSNAYILTAETAYNSLKDGLKKYVTNYDALVTKKDMYNRLEKSKANIDNLLYPITLRNIGPSIFGGWEDKVSFTETQKGVTVEFKETTVHSAGLNVNNPLDMDGLHIGFENCEYELSGEKFALMFYKNAQIDIINENNVLWFTFKVTETGLDISVSSKNNSAKSIISTTMLKKSDMKNWDILLKAEKNGNYTITINGAVSGTIPKSYIEDAKSEGLDTESMYVTLGSNCLGTPAVGSKIKFDCIYAHDGNSQCSDKLYDSFGKDNVLKLKDILGVIASIKLPITKDCGAQIITAENAYKKLPEGLKKYVTSYENLLVMRKMYDRIDKVENNIDDLLYPITLRNIGPSIFGGWEDKVSYTETKKGVTVEFKETTVHSAGLNVNNPLNINGLHIGFENCEYELSGEKFALMFYKNAQIDIINENNVLWLTFKVTDTGLDISVSSKNNSSKSIISTSMLKKSDMKNWDLSLKEEKDGSYTVTVNGTVSGSIPKDYISDAKSEGLDFESMFVTLGSNCLGTPAVGSKIKFDCIYAHDGTKDCSDSIYDEFGESGVKSLKNVLISIKAINLPITKDSGIAIKSAETLYKKLPNGLKKYVTSYEDLIIMRRMYDKITNNCSDMDWVAHPIKKENVGPNIFSGWEGMVDWYEAESGKGVTIDLNNTTVHSVGLNVNKPLSLDGLHITFGKGTYENRAESFALIFHKMAQIDLTSNAKQLWMYFNVSDLGVKISIQSAEKESFMLLYTPYVSKADFEKGWDIKINKQDDGSYILTLNGIVTGTIPKEYIESAVSAGLDINSFIVSLASNNFGNVPYHLNADCISIHDGKSNCYYQVSQTDIEKVKYCEKLIDNIGVVTQNSGNVINIAKKSFDALGEYLQGIVSNRDIFNSKLNEYNIIVKDIEAADKVEILIKKLPNTINDKSYEELLKAYFEYLDLYPRARKYVSNAESLLKLVKNYESSHKGVDLANESMNRHTDGKKAHYLKELIMNLFS